MLDLLAGHADEVARDNHAYQTATGKPLIAGKPGAPEVWVTAPIPGPLRSFARMAAISPDSHPRDILPALAHNVITNGYEASHGNEALEETEYLKLVHRYLSQAHELDKLAGDSKVIEIKNCEAANAADLLRVLGFRMRGGCGSEVVLETVNAARAFLTTDSGFPINRLEEALRTNRAFTYDYHPSQVPVLFGPQYWMAGIKESDPAGFIESFIGDPAMCRLYLGLSKLDTETAEALRKADTYPHLKAYAHVLDFFGGMFEVRDGKAVVPGGQRSAAAWGELVGASPEHGGDFFNKLIQKDDGWLCSLYDALARIGGPVQAYLTDPVRMKRFYTAVRGRITSPGPARPVFRSNTDMMLFTTRLQMDANGKPHIPGNLEVWKALFTNNPQGKYDGKLTRLAATWKDSDDVLEALFALCRKSVENEPLKIFMTVTDLDRNRAAPLAAATVDRLAHDYRRYGSQYPIFAESQTISDQSIDRFLDAAESVQRIRDPLFRSDVAGSFQALVGLWQIFVRQKTIGDDRADAAFSSIAVGFTQVKNDRELFEASRNGLKTLFGGSIPANAQQRMLDLLAGAGTSEDVETRDAVEQDFIRILDAQRMLPLDTLLQLAGQLESGKPVPAATNKLAARIAETPIPRPQLTSNEKNALGFGYYTDRHIEAERKLNIRAAIERAAGDAAKLKDLVGDLAPLMRDTLVAFNYAYYAPPGAQILYTNPVFVRSHDFVGGEGQSRTWLPTETYGYRLAFQRWRTAGGVAFRTGLHAGGSRAEFPDTGADPGADLGRSGSADDFERQDSPLVECHSGPAPLGGFASALWARAAGGIHLRSRRKNTGPGGAIHRGIACADCCRGPFDRAGRYQRGGGCRDPLGTVLHSAPGRASTRARQFLYPGRNAAACGGVAEGSKLCRDFARIRHAQADLGQFLSAGDAEPSDLPHLDGILQSHHGGELGIEHAVLGVPGR